MRFWQLALTTAVAAAIVVVINHEHHHDLSTSSAATCHYQAGGALPDPSCTPGATYKAVTQRTIYKTICVRGWTSTIRPPETVTEPQKFHSMRQYGVAGARDFEFDHLIPLELGGAPDDPHNLWPEPHSSSYTKDNVEYSLNRKVCSGEMSLKTARKIMQTDWRKGQ